MVNNEQQQDCVSIIIPTYNAGDLLKICLNSILAQTYPSIQVVVVDDCSQDNTQSVVEEYQNKFKAGSFLYHRNERNSGVSQSRNIGINFTQGEYIMFVDADDWLEPMACEKLVSGILKDNSDLAICGYFSNGSETETTSYPILCEEEYKYYANEEYADIILNGMIGLYGEQLRHPERSDRLVAVWAKMYKADVIKQNQIYYEDLCKVPSECQLFNLEYCLKGKSACFIREPLYHYRRNVSNSLTKKYQTELFDRWIYYWKVTAGLLKDRMSNAKTEEAYMNNICFSVIQLGGNALRQHNFKKAIREIKFFLHYNDYRLAFQKMQFRYLPVHWKVFFGLAKHRLTFAFYCITRAMRAIMNHRKN